MRPGQGVASGVAEAIADLQQGDRLDEVIVLVPPGATAPTLRRLLPRASGGVAGIRFLTPIDLAVELVDSSVSTMRAVTTQLQLAAITSVLGGDDCPVVLRDVREHAATIDALVDMANALRAAHNVPAALSTLAGEPGSVRAALVDVVERARQRLAALGVRDESATLAAVDAVADATLAELRVVLVVTDTFHPAQVPFIARIARQPMCRMVAVPPNGNDTVLLRQLQRFGCESVPDIEPSDPPRVISCPDADEEVRHAVRLCAEMIDAGVPADDLAIVCAAQTYRRPVRDELQRAGIAWSGGAVERLRGSIGGQVVRQLLDGVNGDWDRPSVFRLLSVAPVYPLGDIGTPRRVGQWTSLCRRLGLVSADDWDRAPAALEEANLARRRRFAHHDIDAPPTRREQAEADALHKLRTLVERLQRQAKRLRKAGEWTTASRVLGGMLADHIGSSTWRERAWATGPAWQRTAADHVERLVAGLAELDHDGVAVQFGMVPLRQILGTLLDTPVRRRGDAAGAVSIADIGGAMCLDAPHVIVVGVNEGVLPASVADDLLLGRDLPDTVAEVVEGPRAVVSRAERAWHALLTSDAHVVATWARSDLRRGGEMHPSPLLTGLPVEEHESHASGVRSGHALTSAERLVRQTDATRSSGRVARRANALRARIDPQPTEFDGIVGSHPGIQPKDGVWAITALEAQARCGLGYFGQYVLGLLDEVDAASIITIEPREKGTLVHDVLEHLAKEWLALDDTERPAWLQGQHLSAMHSRIADILDELAAGIGIQHRLGHASAWAAERAHLLRSMIAALDSEAAEQSRPLACEHWFTGVEVAGAPFKGKIDRIDLLPDGGLRVTDFKTGKVKSVRNPLDSGESLQLPLYARAADHDADLWLPAPRAATPPATARYVQVRDAKAEPRNVVLDDALIAEFEAYVTRWLDEINTGWFVPRPHPANGRCLMCCVDALGVEELAERARLFSPDPDTESEDEDES